MKNQFVETLQDGDTVNSPFVAARNDLRNKQNGGQFLGMVFKDRSGEIGGIMWNNAAQTSRLFAVGDVVNVRAKVNSYQNRLQLLVENILPLQEGEYDLDDLVYTPCNCRIRTHTEIAKPIAPSRPSCPFVEGLTHKSQRWQQYDN